MELPKIRGNPLSTQRKGQEEMTGFVLIVIMLIVLGISFLFLFKPRIETRENLQVTNLLVTMLESTENGVKMSDMIRSCGDNIGCDATKTALDARLSSAMASSGLVLGRLNGYSLTATNPSSTFISITGGNLTGSLETSLVPIQNIDVILRFYY